MELAEFLEKLRETPREHWHLISGRIRTRMNGYMACPINAVAGVTGLYKDAAKSIDLSPELMGRIAESADNGPDMYGEFEPDLRARLLEACGLAGRGEKGGVER